MAIHVHELACLITCGECFKLLFLALTWITPRSPLCRPSPPVGPGTWLLPGHDLFSVPPAHGRLSHSSLLRAHQQQIQSNAPFCICGVTCRLTKSHDPIRLQSADRASRCSSFEDTALPYLRAAVRRRLRLTVLLSVVGVGFNRGSQFRLVFAPSHPVIDVPDSHLAEIRQLM